MLDSGSKALTSNQMNLLTQASFSSFAIATGQSMETLL